jgi:hypothetical protein
MDNSKNTQISEMQKVSQEEVLYYDKSRPEAIHFQSFPDGIWSATWLGILIGTGIGLIFGVLMFQGIITIPGWEGLFSMTPFTFHVFWGVVGLALGLITGGLIGMAVTPPDVLIE